MEKSIDQKKQELDEINQKISYLTSQKNNLLDKIRAKQRDLADDILLEKNSSSLLSEIEKLQKELDKTGSTLNAASSRVHNLRKDIKESEKAGVIAQIEIIKGDYVESVTKVIESLNNLWKAARQMETQFQEVSTLSIEYDLGNPLHFSSIGIGGLTLSQFSHYTLAKLEKYFPEETKQVIHQSYKERIEELYSKNL